MGYTPSAGLHTHLLGPTGNLETHTSIGVLAGAGPFPRVSEHSAGDRFSSEAVGVWYHLETNAPKRVLPLAYSNTEQVLAAPGCYASDASCRPQQAGSCQRARRGSTKPTSVQTKRRTSPARSAALGGWPCSPLDVMPPPPEGARGDGGGPPRPLPSRLQLNAYGRKGWETTPKAPADPWMSRRPMDTARELAFLLWRHKQSCTQQHCLPHAHGSPPSRHPTRRSRRRSRGRARGLRRAPDYLVTQVPSPHCYGQAVKAQTG